MKFKLIIIAILICNVANSQSNKIDKVVLDNHPFQVAEKDLPMNFDPNPHFKYKIKSHEGKHKK